MGAEPRAARLSKFDVTVAVRMAVGWTGLSHQSAACLEPLSRPTVSSSLLSGWLWANGPHQADLETRMWVLAVSRGATPRKQQRGDRIVEGGVEPRKWRSELLWAPGAESPGALGDHMEYISVLSHRGVCYQLLGLSD